MTENLREWLRNRPAWFIEATKRLLEKHTLTDVDYDDFVKTIMSTNTNVTNPSVAFLTEETFNRATTTSLSLLEIKNIIGINALAPKKPLLFEENSMTVIYGDNGTGKSGYTRILKNVCGDQTREKLHSNVFNASSKQCCTVSYKKNSFRQDVQWDAQNTPIDDLRDVAIFDAKRGEIFISGENEVTYEPPVLRLFSSLIITCEQVSMKLNAQLEAIRIQPITLPPIYANGIGQTWINKLTYKTKKSDIDSFCFWPEEKENELVELNSRLAEKSPNEKAQMFRKQKATLSQLQAEIHDLFVKLTDAECNKIITSFKNVQEAQNIAKLATEKLFADTPLKGISTGEWIQLWESARTFSRSVAYENEEYPVVAKESRCVLCQQILSEETKERLISFEEYIRNKTQNNASRLDNEHKNILASLPDIPTDSNIALRLDVSGISDEAVKKDIILIYALMRIRLQYVKEPIDDAALPVLLPLTEESIATHIKSKLSEYEVLSKKYEEDSLRDNRSELEKRRNELASVKWLYEQRDTIHKYVDFLQNEHRYKNALAQTKTTVISEKKGELAQHLITDAFITRFNTELTKLGATNIKVELQKTRVSKGRVLHQIKLKGTVGNLAAILSEGENKIISLAAFLADMTGKHYHVPFVFDDPVSSLDQNFEDHVVKRIIELSHNSQVIIFTHRLSFLGVLDNYMEKETLKTVKIIAIGKEPWGTGEVRNLPLFSQKPDKALNTLLNDRLSLAKKIYAEQGLEKYELEAKAICSEFRILLERMIEEYLLSAVVLRYRRGIQTAGRIQNLAKINTDDCSIFDEFMTKYSRYEHSQPQESPLPPPLPDELSNDMDRLKQWKLEFDNKLKT